jgi:hypothetical protein
VGDGGIKSSRDSNAAGTAEAFLYTAATSGTATRLFVYLDSTSTAGQVVVGLYSNAAGDVPGTLLGQAAIASPAKGAWNAVDIAPVGIAAGTKYWIAVLNPPGSGTIQFRDTASGGKAQSSAQTSLTALPTTWSPGQNWTGSPMSAYAAQVP